MKHIVYGLSHAAIHSIIGLAWAVLKLFLGLLFLAATQGPAAQAGSTTTLNFSVVSNRNQQDTETVGMWAEYWRDLWAEKWLGRRMPPWRQRCQLQTTFGRHSGGFTAFTNAPWPVEMKVDGEDEQHLLFNVLPHEVTHTVLHHHFGRPLPRWADEGAACCSESSWSEAKEDERLAECFRDGLVYPLRQLLPMMEYPASGRRVMALYAQGHSLTRFLISAGGRPRFLVFLAEQPSKGWNRAIADNYGFEGTAGLEQSWLAAVRGSGNDQRPRPPSTRPQQACTT